MKRFKRISRFVCIVTIMLGLSAVSSWQPLLERGLAQGLEQDEIGQQETERSRLFAGLPSFVGDQKQLSAEELDEAIAVTNEHIADLVTRIFDDKPVRLESESDWRKALREVDEPIVIELIQSSYYLRGLERIRVHGDLKALLAKSSSQYVYDLIQKMLLKNELASLFEIFEARLERQDKIKRHSSSSAPGPMSHFAVWTVPVVHGGWHLDQIKSFRHQRRYYEAIAATTSGQAAKTTIGNQLREIGGGSLHVDRPTLYRQIRALDKTLPLPWTWGTQVTGELMAAAMLPDKRVADTRMREMSAALRTRMNPRARELAAFIESGDVAANTVLRQQAATLVRATGPIDHVSNLLEDRFHDRAESIIRSYEIQGAVRQINEHMPDSVSATRREGLLGQLKSDSRMLRHLSQGRMSFARGAGNSMAIVGEVAMAVWLSSLLIGSDEESRQWRKARGLGADEFQAMQEAFDMHGRVSKGDLHQELWRLSGAIDAVKPIVEDRFDVRLPQVPELTSTAAHLAKVLAR